MNNLYKENGLGQLEIDFEVLESLVSEVMVSEIKKDLLEEDTTIIAVRETSRSIQLVVTNKYDYTVTIYDALKNNKHDYDVMHIHKDFICQISDSLRGVK